ncbi:MAG: Flp family type IVb pilin [bacterium]|nr:Flp family type IVb pilin [bacterium]
MMDIMMRFFKDEDGATAVEYALLLGLIALVIATGASALGISIEEYFNKIAEMIKGFSTRTSA